MNKEQFKKLQSIYTALRDAEELVIPEININNFTKEEVEASEKSFTDFYHAVEDIKHSVGLLLDELQKKN